MQTRTKPEPQDLTVRTVPSKTKPMHRYVWGLLGIFVLFVGSFFLAMGRVADSARYEGEAFNSLNWEDNQKDNLNYPKP